jgi:hypothetical protein
MFKFASEKVQKVMRYLIELEESVKKDFEALEKLLTDQEFEVEFDPTN